jgi:hypothetical protein
MAQTIQLVFLYFNDDRKYEKEVSEMSGFYSAYTNEFREPGSPMFHLYQNGTTIRQGQR